MTGHVKFWNGRCGVIDAGAGQTFIVLPSRLRSEIAPGDAVTFDVTPNEKGGLMASCVTRISRSTVLPSLDAPYPAPRPGQPRRGVHA